MKKNEYFINKNIQERINKSKEYSEEIVYNSLSQLEKDILIIINYIRTNPLDFCNNLIVKNKYKMQENKEQIEIINYLEGVYNKERLAPFEEIPEISDAARNLLVNIALNDKKYHNINLKEIKPSTLNLRTRLSNYGHRTGRIFETVVFKTNNPEDIINHILIDENGRNMLLSNKMKYIGVACDILPSNIICSVIDIVQDFFPYKKDIIYNNININDNYDNYNNYDNYDNYNNYDKYDNYDNYDNYDKNDLESNYYRNQNREEYQPIIDNFQYDNNNINNLKLKLNVRDKKNENNNPNMNIIINNNNNEQYNPNFINNNNKYKNNQRKKNVNLQNNLYYKTPKKIASMDLPSEKENFFSPKSINSYNIIINNKIVPEKNKSNNNINNINVIKKEENNNKVENEKNNIFTMAGRTCKEQQEVIEISSKINLNKSKSACSFDLNLNNSKINNNKNKLQRLNQKEKLEILHKINQRNKNPKSVSNNNNNIDIIKSVNPIYSKNINENDLFKKRSYNLEIDNEDKNKIKKYSNLNIEIDNNYENKLDYNNSNRINTCTSKISKINDSNLVNYCNINGGNSPLNPSFFESKYSQAFSNNEEYSKNKINEIKSDLLLIKNQIKKELKDEVKNEIKEEIKYEFNISQNKRKPNSIKTEQEFDIGNIINNKRKISNNYNSQDETDKNKIKIIDDEIYFKKNNSNHFLKNRFKNRCSSEDKIIYTKNNANFKLKKNNERKTFEPHMNINNNNQNNYLKNKYKERYEHLNELQKNIKSEFNFSDYPNNNINSKNISTDLKNKSYFNEGPKVKNRQEIKQLIRLYNMAKDNKKNKINNENVYDIINNNKSITNFFAKNKNNNEEEIIININKQNNENNENNENKCEVKNNEFKKIEKENIKRNKLTKGYIFQKKYEKVKPVGNFHKLTKNINNNNNNKTFINNNKIFKEEKNKINDNNKKDNNENCGNNENIKEKDNLKNIKENKEEKENNYSINEKYSSTGTFNEDINQNNLNDNNNQISIKSYNDKNIIKDGKKERKYKSYYSNSQIINKKELNNITTNNKIKELNINDESKEKKEKIENNTENNIVNKDKININKGNINQVKEDNKNINNNKDNGYNNLKIDSKIISNNYISESLKNENEKYKTPFQVSKEYKYDLNDYDKFNNNNIYNPSKTTTYKEKKYYQYFPLKYKNLDYNNQIINGGNGKF